MMKEMMYVFTRDVDIARLAHLSCKDVRKVLWSMQHIMHNDPRRRATFGMTIENFMIRIWFCCRSTVVVSERFDFMAVRLFISLNHRQVMFID